MNKKLVAVILSASYCIAAQAADTYSVDPSHTFASFSYRHLGFSTATGKFPAKSGTIVLDRTQKTGSVDVTFAIADVLTGVKKLDEHFQAADFFDTKKNPTATFKSKSITFNGDTPASITGDLTLKGVTKPVTLQVTSFHCGDHPMMKVPACGADATTQIKRSDFGLGLYAPVVGDEVTLTIEVEAAKK